MRQSAGSFKTEADEKPAKTAAASRKAGIERVLPCPMALIGSRAGANAARSAAARHRAPGLQSLDLRGRGRRLPDNAKAPGLADPSLRSER